jgi:hypothetical protein
LYEESISEAKINFAKLAEDVMGDKDEKNELS